MAWYQDDLTMLAFCWRLQRSDGIALGFTSNDRDLVLDGMTYRAAPGMAPSAIERRADLDAASVELRGALTSDLITGDDIEAGRWDGARLELHAVDANDPDGAPRLLVSSTLGGIESDGRGFATELQGSATLLDRAIVEETSPECRAALGDKRCRVDLAGRRRLARVVSAAEEAITLDSALGAVDDYAWGSLRWLDGANAGLASTIVASGANTVTLRERPWRMPAAGTLAELTQGCDKRFSTCWARFANALNFRGEPHLPGNDLLVRYAR